MSSTFHTVAMLIRCVRKIIITWISRPSVWSIIAYAVSIRWCSDILSHLILFKTFTLTLLVFIDTVILISSTSRYLTQMEYIAQVGEPIKGSVRILNIRLREKKLCSSSWVRPRSYPRKKINIFVLVYSFLLCRKWRAKIQTVVRIVKSWTDYERAIRQSDSKI